jgi:beta-glucosidase
VLLAAAVAVCALAAPAGRAAPASAPLPALFDDIQERTFRFFWELGDARTGLVPDRFPRRSPSSIAAVGFALTAYPIGVERGYVTRAQARERVLATLRFFDQAPQGAQPTGRTGHRGFFYHFLDMKTGHRAGPNVELSTIDTTLLLAGMLFCQSYFDGPDAQERAIRELAERIYARVDWNWAAPRPPIVSMGWRPEVGHYESGWRIYDESMILYLLALASPSHPLPPSAWQAYTADRRLEEYRGQRHVNFAPLFGHQYSHLWVDFRDILDESMAAKGLDYFENSRRATLAQRAYAIANPGGWKGYGPDVWGLTACDGPGAKAVVNGRPVEFWGYAARGAAAGEERDDGTLAPTAALGSLPFAPEIVVPAVTEMHRRHGAHLYSKYGFLDAFNPSVPDGTVVREGRVVPGAGWFDTDYLGIDQGPILAMIENHRNGFVWGVMRKNPHLRRGLLRAGFRGGWIDEVRRDQGAAVEARVGALLARMTPEEKIGQLQQLDGDTDGRYRAEHLELARKGLLGSTLNVRGAKNVNELQKAALESRLRIPLLFGYDTIHGYRTIFPIPLGEAAAFDPALAEATARVAAAESAAVGLKWTFAPMVDVARDPRWGRVAEGAGEDPYLGSVLARARVRGFQGHDYALPDRVVATAKHWVGYGAAEGGRDYDTTDLSERALREVYFPPFKAAVDAGVGTFMSAFNDVDGTPATANPFTLTQVLRGEWRFDGLVVSDYTSVLELLKHGIAADEAEAARKAIVAGVDMEMVSRLYGKHLPELVRRNAVPGAVLDEAVRRILRVKARAGLFERPYADEAREAGALLTAESRALARQAAARSMVLLRNEGGLLPLRKDLGTIAVIGPLADDRQAVLGSWSGDGRKDDAISILSGVQAAVPKARVVHAKGCDVEGGGPEGIPAAVDAARAADAVVLVVGESADMSGEAASRSVLDLPGRQMELVRAVHAAGKPTVVVLVNGRPLTLPWIAENVPAILEAWQGGTEAGHAVADVLFGDVNPGGKLPITFPRSVGQVPIYYAHKNTGRPPAAEKWTSKYLDVPFTPQFPFGHGVSYTTFELSGLKVEPARIAPGQAATVQVTVKNTGSRAGDEVVQVYVTDVAASVTRTVKQLRAFERVPLQPGGSRTLAFTLGPADLGLLDQRMRWVVEPGVFRITAGNSSQGGLTAPLEVTAPR